jgi:hypothetical protein
MNFHFIKISYLLEEGKTALYPKWWASNTRAFCQKLCGFPITQQEFKEKIDAYE